VTLSWQHVTYKHSKLRQSVHYVYRDYEGCMVEPSLGGGGLGIDGVREGLRVDATCHKPNLQGEG